MKEVEPRHSTSEPLKRVGSEDLSEGAGDEECSNARSCGDCASSNGLLLARPTQDCSARVRTELIMHRVDQKLTPSRVTLL